MHRILRSLGLVGLIACAMAQAAGVQEDAAKNIEGDIRGLRKLPDAAVPAEIKRIARVIAALPSGQGKLDLAEFLANRSTEGDFGRETLQQVTDTLVLALREHPAPREKGEPASAYLELAELARYEGMKVWLKTPDYAAALAKVDATDAARRKADFTLTDLGGKKWTLSKLRGNVVVVNFWATWCPPCRKEMPDLEKLYHQFKPKGLVILSISDEPDAKVRPFIAEHKYSYPILLDPGRKVNERYRVAGIPKSFVYDRRGRMVAQSIDMRTRGQFLALLAKAGLH
ncbi:MAG: TlpA family protein disulfide reductase [Fimbriimonas ginsengisoli]|uniref:TlpA family protein disulfide reductase n=1 Tax=Fimbriimonas ginsengisoli TaxID=1005039 RepID=A0A931PW77_FIMGI|nr:TlpA family protein disulfide reductase [Fimbriimonas ginsengisoli]